MTPSAAGASSGARKSILATPSTSSNASSCSSAATPLMSKPPIGDRKTGSKLQSLRQDHRLRSKMPTPTIKAPVKKQNK